MERRPTLNQLLTTVDYMDVNYLSTLDYIDMRTLCMSSKQLSYICNDNSSLRSIIYNKNENVKISPNFNISGALKDIYAAIQKVIDGNYPEETLPRWVNKKLFNDDMLRNFMNYFLGPFIDAIDDLYNEGNKGPLSQIDTIELWRPLVIAVLYPKNMDYDDFEGLGSHIPYTIIIPKSFYEYITPTVNRIAIYIEDGDDGNYYDLDHQILLKALSDMLFVKY